MSENPSIESRTDAQHAGQIDARHGGQIDAQHRDLADIPAVEVISRAAVMLMSAAAEKLGLSDPDPDDSEHRDLDEARRLITALAGLVTAAMPISGRTQDRCVTGCARCNSRSARPARFPTSPARAPAKTTPGRSR